MSPRFAPIAAALVLLVVAACAAPTAVAPSPVAPVAVAPTPALPTPTPVPTSDAPTPPLTGPTPTSTPNAGQVDGSGTGPLLTVEFPGDRLVDVTLEDAEARAWRVVVAGTGALAEDRFEIVVEAGDVGPVITATEIARRRGRRRDRPQLLRRGHRRRGRLPPDARGVRRLVVVHVRGRRHRPAPDPAQHARPVERRAHDHRRHGRLARRAVRARARGRTPRRSPGAAERAIRRTR